MSLKLPIAGVGMVPFRRPGQSESYDVMGAAAVCAALADARLDCDLVDAAFAAFVFADTSSGQRALHRAGLSGIPIVNVNNRCASGSSALHLARQAVLSGDAECALALGFEELSPGARGRAFPSLVDPIGRHLECVSDSMGYGERERELAPALQLYGAQLEWMSREMGIADRAFAQVAVKSRAHARHNPLALCRESLSVEDVLAGPPLAGRLREAHAAPASCGAAAVILCTPRFAARHGLRHDVALLSQVVLTETDADLEFPNVLDALGRGATRRAAARAYEQSGVGPGDIDVAEVHDSFVGNEMIACASLGFCAEDEIERFVLEGGNTHGGRVVIGPSGGLLAKGHPPGVTGLAQIAELVWQLRGEAGDRQVDGARTALQHNGGPGGAHCVAILQAC